MERLDHSTFIIGAEAVYPKNEVQDLGSDSWQRPIYNVKRQPVYSVQLYFLLISQPYANKLHKIPSRNHMCVVEFNWLMTINTEQQSLAATDLTGPHLFTSGNLNLALIWQEAWDRKCASFRAYQNTQERSWHLISAASERLLEAEVTWF